ncbi:hypothetical protein [Sphingobium aquiterrae]|uniref:hypothetical protein n=1 Tax=Sphingobium aquiterrae TaxID=2038656 RepID=UPI00301680D5
MAPPQVDAPASFVPQQAIAFGSLGGPAVAVDAANPLPTVARPVAAQSMPLAGSASASGLIGPFQPELGRAIWVTLGGSWTGSVTVKRSVDGGATTQGLTIGGSSWAVFAANVNEPVAEESEAAASYYLDVALTSGTLTYRVAQ